MSTTLAKGDLDVPVSPTHRHTAGLRRVVTGSIGCESDIWAVTAATACMPPILCGSGPASRPRLRRLRAKILAPFRCLPVGVFMFRRKCRKTVARARSFPAVRHDATNRTKVLRERAAPTGKVCHCWMASSRSAARCFAVSPCDSALPPHYSSRSISGAGHDKSSDPQACRDAHPRRFLSTPSEPWQTKSRTWCAPAGQ